MFIINDKSMRMFLHGTLRHFDKVRVIRREILMGVCNLRRLMLRPHKGRKGNGGNCNHAE